ncbi:MAG: aminotransferase class I/II-fold pyridoxal phosphate-dependent enzyme [Desulfobacterales bacterium]
MTETRYPTIQRGEEENHEPHELYLSRIAAQTSQSEIRSMTFACRKYGGINLAQGIADLSVPEAVRKNARHAVDQGHNIYTSYMGTDAIRAAISEKLKRYNKIDADPEKNIVATAGATGVFHRLPGTFKSRG